MMRAMLADHLNPTPPTGPAGPMPKWARWISGAAMLLVLGGCQQIPLAPIEPPSAQRQQLVVFDIDGTLTPRNLDLFEARPGAAQAARALAGKGYAIVYLTTRTPLFQGMLPGWLREHGFAPGTLHVAQTADERADPARFKAGLLAAYVRQGWRLARAYGDSPTDFEAYAQAGVPKERVYALKRRGDDQCQPGAWQACLDGWEPHLAAIDALPAP